MLTDIALLLALIVVNGLFAMSEIAVVSSRRSRLTQLADGGSRGAATALELSSQPTRFLSSVQVGITTIGILSGALGEATLAARLRESIELVPQLAPYAHGLAVAVVVLALSYVSLIVGELAPKRLALTHPERIASLVSRPMKLVSAVGRPVVHFLSASTDAVLKLLRVRQVAQPGVTLEELRVLIEQSTEEGVLEKTEEELVQNVLDLDERQVGAILTPRSDVVFLDLDAPFEDNARILSEHPHHVVPLCRGSLDNVVGFVRSTDVLTRLLRHERVDLQALATEALFVPHSVSVMTLLEQFRRNHLPVALVVGEFGEVDGIVSLTDVVATIVGDRPPPPGEEPDIVRREDGSLLVDGGVEIDVVREVVAMDAFGEEAGRYYHTLGGFIMHELGRVPRTGDLLERQGVRFEVVDMDGNRIDRVLIVLPQPRPAAGDQAP